jgi:hypothetical protein
VKRLMPYLSALIGRAPKQPRTHLEPRAWMDDDEHRAYAESDDPQDAARWLCVNVCWRTVKVAALAPDGLNVDGTVYPIFVEVSEDCTRYRASVEWPLGRGAS